VFLRWKTEVLPFSMQDANVPDAISDIYAWAIANGEQLPDGSFGKYEDLTGQSASRIFTGLKIFAARLQITNATAQHFKDDARFFTLGYKRLDDETGDVLASNWDEPLDVTSRTRALTYLTNHGYTVQQIAARFSALDTRREIAVKLKKLFLED